MRGWLDLQYPQVSAYLVGEAWSNFEKSLGKQDHTNVKVIKGQLVWAREYVAKHKETLIPKGIYAFKKQPHFLIKELDSTEITCELTYFLSIQEDEAMQELEEQSLLVSLLKTAFMDSARHYISKTLLPTLYKNEVQNENIFVSPCLGPGLFSLPIEHMAEFFQYLQVPEELATLKGSSCLPMTSFVGVIYGLSKPYIGSPCKACSSHGNCQLCMVNHYMETSN